MVKKRRVLFVGSFIEKAKDGSVGGQMYACRSIIASDLNSYIDWILLDNKGESVPSWYGNNTNYPIKASNLCSEIMLPSNNTESFVCCLSSLNLAKYDEWKNSNVVELSVYFLDAVMSEFIVKTENMRGLERARKFAIKHRALGLGVLGWHTYLQSKSIPFTGLQSNSLTRVIFKQIKTQAEEASDKLAIEYAPCEVCLDAGVNRRNTTLIAEAPTVI
jgi:ribonucleoside-diphosphate reductase alpha chain